MLTNNAIVTWNELNTMGLTLIGGSAPTGNKIVTKGDINTYYYTSTTSVPYINYPSNRCPRYQDIVSADTGCRNSTSAWLSNSYQMKGNDQSISSDPAMRLPARDQRRCRRANDSDRQLHLDQTRVNLCRTRQDARLITLDIAL